jgi:hypothetical protein
VLHIKGKLVKRLICIFGVFAAMFFSASAFSADPSKPFMDRAPAEVCSGVTYNDASGTVQTGTEDCSLPVAGNCSSGNQTGCETVNNYPASKSTGFNSVDMRIAVSGGSVTGTLKTNCRNMVNSSNYNYDGDVATIPEVSVTTGTAIDHWDTTDDYANNPGGYPTSNPWNADYFCNQANWQAVGTGTDCFTAGDSGECVYLEEFSGLMFSEVQGTAATWQEAIDSCNGLNFGGYSVGWRVPTQKEFMKAYVNGIYDLDDNEIGDLKTEFWSSSTRSTFTATQAWGVIPANGDTGVNTKTNTRSFLCVR